MCGWRRGALTRPRMPRRPWRRHCGCFNWYVLLLAVPDTYYYVQRRDLAFTEGERDPEVGLQWNPARASRRRIYRVEAPIPAPISQPHMSRARVPPMGLPRRTATDRTVYSIRPRTSKHMKYAAGYIQRSRTRGDPEPPIGYDPHLEDPDLGTDSVSTSFINTASSADSLPVHLHDAMPPPSESRPRPRTSYVALERISRIQYKGLDGKVHPRELPESEAMKHGRLRASAIPGIDPALEESRIALVTHFDEAGNTRLHTIKIQSAAFMGLLRESGKYKLHHSFKRGFFIFTEPFVDIFCRRDALRQYVRGFKAAPRKKSALKNTANCAQLVLDLLDGDFAATSQRFDLYRSVDAPSEINFADLWAIYPPGSLVFVLVEGQPPCALMVDSVKYSISTYDSSYDQGNSLNQKPPLHLHCWYIDFHKANGQYSGKFSRQSHTVAIQPFEGERQISQLNYVPIAFFKDKVIKDQIKKSGQIFWQLTGPSFRELPKLNRAGHPTMERERIMVDPPSEDSIPREGIPEFVDDNLDSASHMAVAGVPYSGPQIDVIEDLNDSQSLLGEYDIIDPSSEPTETMLLLCPQWVRAFSLREKIWSRYEVGKLEPVQFQDNAWSRLVINQEYKDVVQAMVNSHLRGSDTFNDLIPGKGGGVVILLHGPPGVGKTLTAESVAENVRKPLYMVTAGDLGTDPETLEAKLSNIFKLATKWDAILLLDEADVFLQDRDYENLIRNALVSIFLRTLEYFKGIMFLTSNRVGAFDQAFQSRIHITLGIPEFNTQVRKEVWRIFLTDLGRRRRDGSAPLLTREECRSLGQEVLQSWASKPINGRQIRNCVRSALALAQDKNEKVAAKHFNTVIELGDMFTKYLNRLQKAEAEEVAQIKGDRLADMRSLVAQCKTPATNGLGKGTGNRDDNGAKVINGVGEHSLSTSKSA